MMLLSTHPIPQKSQHYEAEMTLAPAARGWTWRQPVVGDKG